MEKEGIDDDIEESKLLPPQNLIPGNGPMALQIKSLRIFGFRSNSQFCYVTFLTIRSFIVVAKFDASQKKYTFRLLYNYLRNYIGNKCMIAFFINTLKQDA